MVREGARTMDRLLRHQGRDLKAGVCRGRCGERRRGTCRERAGIATFRDTRIRSATPLSLLSHFSSHDLKCSIMDITPARPRSPAIHPNRFQNKTLFTIQFHLHHSNRFFQQDWFSDCERFRSSFNQQPATVRHDGFRFCTRRRTRANVTTIVEGDTLCPTMKELPDITDILEAARAYAERGLPIIPLNGKIPAICDWQKFVANAVNVELWFGSERSANIGLRTGESGYVVVDSDTDLAEIWVTSHLPESTMRARSGAGSTHRFYEAPPRKEIRNRQGWKRVKGLDVRGQGGFIVLAPSRHPETGEPYRWLTDFLEPDQLPRFSPAWVYERTRRRAVQCLESPTDGDFMEFRAARWLETVEGAVSGQGGHNKTFRVASRLTHLPPIGFGLGFEAALRLMLRIFNPKCRPEWSEKELRHKLEGALKARK